jgi:hypothetical protein
VVADGAWAQEQLRGDVAVGQSWAASRATCSSCGVSRGRAPPPGCGLVAPVVLSSARACAAQGAAPIRSKYSTAARSHARRPCGGRGAATRRTAAGNPRYPQPSHLRPRPRRGRTHRYPQRDRPGRSRHQALPGRLRGRHPARGPVRQARPGPRRQDRRPPGPASRNSGRRLRPAPPSSHRPPPSSPSWPASCARSSSTPPSLPRRPSRSNSSTRSTSAAATTSGRSSASPPARNLLQGRGRRFVAGRIGGPGRT